MSRFIDQIRLRMRSVFHGPKADQELEEEFQYHLQRQIDEGLANGLSPEDARHAAMRVLGAVAQSKEECRRARQLNWFQDAVRDVHYGARMLRRDRAFTTVAVLALALGIGANTVMFSVAWSTLLRPLPFAHAERLAVVFMDFSPRDFHFGTMCIRDYLMWKENNRAFENPSLFSYVGMDLSGSGRVPEHVQGALVTAGFFSTLGVQPIAGRTFAADEDRPGSRHLAVLGESIWRRRFGANPRIIGGTMVVNGAPATVIGVMPAAFRFPSIDTDVWTNLPLNPPTRYGPWFYRAVARLKPGVTLDQARAELSRLALLMMQQNPDYKRLNFPMLYLRDAILGPQVKPAILMLLGAVGLLLLIAVVNVVNLMLARATVREREIAVRLSLGAARGRLMRQLLTESVLLALLGGAAGLVLAWGGIALIRAWNPANLPFIESVQLDWRALVFMILASSMTGVLFGLAPAWQSTRADLNRAMKEGGRSSGLSPARQRTRAALVMAEIALSLMLLTGAGLLLRSFVNLQQVNGGFSAPPNEILTMLISPDRKYNDERAGMAFYGEVLRSVRAVPGVEAAALTDSLPPENQGDADTFGIEGQTLAPGQLNPVISTVTASPDLFQTLGIPLIAGRCFNEHDTPNSKRVAIVSEGFARRFFPGRQVLGKRIRHSGAMFGEPWMEIVGVVGNVKYLGLTADTDAAYYMPFGQNYDSRMSLAVRASGDMAGLSAALRRKIQAVDRGVTLSQVSTMEEALSDSVSQPRFDTSVLGLFAGIALLLAAVGIYGLISWSVAQRTREIGLRMVLGASRTEVVRMVVGQGTLLAGAGIALGLVGAFALTRLLRSMLFGVGATDGMTFIAAPLAMMIVVLAATSWPAFRATRISPVTALRNE